MATGYDWVEEIKTINDLFMSIMPVEEERECHLRILATGLSGVVLEKFILFNGGGRNGKGVENDLYLHALGDYGFRGNNALLIESPKQGANPETANIHKKRYVVFREPSNSSMDLT